MTTLVTIGLFFKTKQFKKRGQMQLAKRNLTSDPFVVYGYYEMLKKEVDRLGVQVRPECFYNCNESGFPQRPI